MGCESWSLACTPKMPKIIHTNSTKMRMLPTSGMTEISALTTFLRDWKRESMRSGRRARIVRSALKGWERMD